jgi:hypothetical protein
VPDKFTILLENIQTLAGVVVEFSKANANQATVKKAAEELNSQIDCLIELRTSIFGTVKATTDVPSQGTGLPAMSVPPNYPNPIKQ